MNDITKQTLMTIPLKKLFEEHSELRELFLALRLEQLDETKPMLMAIKNISEEVFRDLELTRETFVGNFGDMLESFSIMRTLRPQSIDSLQILGGINKAKEKENVDITIQKGQIISVVGPTGSGKSRLLADIECLAQKDTPTRRTIYLNGALPAEEVRFSMENRLIAQLSQNMNFILDLTVQEFLEEHAKSRLHPKIEEISQQIFVCANELAGESFGLKTPMTQLSGGQSRALMIADTALLSDSPIVLIDEIENAGIDRRRAVKLLAKEEKIVLISTHDPLLAMSADIRLVIRNGGIIQVLEANQKEKENIPVVEAMDQKLLQLREYLRTGRVIDFDIVKYFTL